MMTPRENFIHYLKDEPYEWTPTNLDIRYFRPQEICENVARGMVNQQTPFAGEYGGLDLFGCDWEFEAAVGGSMEKGLLMDDLDDWKEKMTFPDLDKIDWEGCAARNKDYLNTDKIIETTIFTGYFERMIAMVGFENAAMALVDEDMEDTVNELFTKLTETYLDLIERMHRYFNVEIVEIHDDWGTQRSPMFSVETHKDMIAPHIKNLVEGAHKLGVFVEQHSCGFIEPLIPSLIATGMDCWRGQAINDRHKLVDLYGDQFHFCAEIRPAGALEDEAVMKLMDETYAEWAGKNIMLMVGRTFTPKQLDMMADYVRSHGRV